MEIPDGEERDREIFETMTENFPKIMSDTKLQIQDALRMLDKKNSSPNPTKCTSVKL